MESAFNKDLTIEIVEKLETVCRTVIDRCAGISNADEFYLSPEGMMKLDSVCMLVITIGEGIKRIEKRTKGTLLNRYPQVNWTAAMGMRNIIAHQYFDIDAEEILSVVQLHLPLLLATLLIIRKELESNCQ